MTEAEIAQYLGGVFGSYVIGWCSGYAIYAFKKFMGFI